MTIPESIGARRNPQAAVRIFEDDLDRLLDDFLIEIVAALPDRYVPVPFDDEGVRRIGSAIAIADAEIEDGLEERVDEAFSDFAWSLTRTLRVLRESVKTHGMLSP